MAASLQRPRLTPEEYLALEESSPIRHEYVDGEIYAMAGGTDDHPDDHNAIALNCASILKAHLRGSSCRAFISDVKTQLDSLNNRLRIWPRGLNGEYSKAEIPGLS
ncbi:MAG: Uma2 family endonuclease [Synechococcales cyanobacterium CRU_2_2]|nr:Uma2 family endonuclease [Synechococcales cyanobacterium CRU_2_2]